jgi:vancomycin resistance protein VanJ
LNSTGQPVFTVMTYNVGNGLVPPDRLITLLNRSVADVIGLQEVDAAQAAAIESLANAFPYRVVRGTGFSGRALLSRYPISTFDWLDLAPTRSDLRAIIDLNGASLTVIVAHPEPPRLRKRGLVFDPSTVAQIEQLAALTANSAPAVLLGDFNLTPGHSAYATMVAAGLVDAHLASGTGRGSTFPLRLGQIRRGDHHLSWIPLPAVVRVDYVWHSPDLVTLDSWVGDRGDSDHRPVLARLKH